jgi:hypothetical protein
MNYIFHSTRNRASWTQKKYTNIFQSCSFATRHQSHLYTKFTFIYINLFLLRIYTTLQLVYLHITLHNFPVIGFVFKIIQDFDWNLRTENIIQNPAIIDHVLFLTIVYVWFFPPSITVLIWSRICFHSTDFRMSKIPIGNACSITKTYFLSFFNINFSTRWINSRRIRNVLLPNTSRLFRPPTQQDERGK